MAPETQAQASAEETRKLTLILHETVLGEEAVSPKIPVEIEAGGKKYVGTFVFRRPTVYTIAAIGARSAELQSVYNPATGEWERRVTDAQFNVLAQKMATLESVVVKEQRPAWFNMEVLTDPEVLHAVFEAYSKWRDSFRGPVQKPPEGPASTAARP